MAQFMAYRNPSGNGYLLDLQADINRHLGLQTSGLRTRLPNVEG